MMRNPPNHREIALDPVLQGHCNKKKVHSSMQDNKAVVFVDEQFLWKFHYTTWTMIFNMACNVILEPCSDLFYTCHMENVSNYTWTLLCYIPDWG